MPTYAPKVGTPTRASRHAEALHAPLSLNSDLGDARLLETLANHSSTLSLSSTKYMYVGTWIRYLGV